MKENEVFTEIDSQGEPIEQAQQGDVTIDPSLMDGADSSPEQDTPPIEGELREVESPEQVEELQIQESDNEVAEEEITKVLDSEAQEAPVEDTPDQLEFDPQNPEVALEEPAEASTSTPEGLEDLAKFLADTGGTLEDYVSLNKNVDDLPQDDLLRDYYKEKKPYWSENQVDRYIKKNFEYDEDIDDPDDIEDKKMALEEELYKAKQSLTEKKDKYYKDIRSTQASAGEAQSQFSQELRSDFESKTNEIFNEDFTGFSFDIGREGGDVRYKVGNVDNLKSFQSDAQNFASKFFGDDGRLSDADGYHKAMFLATNGEKLAQMAYQQGRADTIKDGVKESKNIQMTPSQGKTSAPVSTLRPGDLKEVKFTNESSQRVKIPKNWGN